MKFVVFSIEFSHICCYMQNMAMLSVSTANDMPLANLKKK